MLVLLLACEAPPPPPPPDPAPEGPQAQLMQHREREPVPELPACNFDTPPLEGLATARGSSWALPPRTGADGAALPPEAMIVLARAGGAAGSQLLALSCEARTEAGLVPGSRQWLVQLDAAGALTWSAPIGLQDVDTREWWSRPRIGWSSTLLGAVELRGDYEDVGAAYVVSGRATAYVAPGPASALAPDPRCPYTRPFRADTARRLIVFEDARVKPTAPEVREARLRMTLSGGPSYRVDERWNWPKGVPEFGKVVDQPREEGFSRRVEWQGELGGFVHVCPSSLPPASVRSG